MESGSSKRCMLEISKHCNWSITKANSFGTQFSRVDNFEKIA